MECGNVRERLSPYLENGVSPDERRLIEEHLKSCAVCSTDLADLRKTIEHIKSLEDVEPPTWMTQKIMTKLRDEAGPKKGILSRLFYPLHVKVPLEAVAAILVIGLALYIYRDIRPAMRSTKAPSEESSPQIFQRGKTEEDKRSPLAKSEVKKTQPEVTTAPERPAQKPLAGKTDAEIEKREEAAKAPAPPGPTPIMREGAEMAPLRAPAGSATGSLKRESQRETIRQTSEMKELLERKIERSILTVRVRELENANKEVERIIISSGGKITERQYSEGRMIFTIELKASKIDELLEKLKLVGEVTKQGPALNDHEEDIGVKIETVEEQKTP